MGMAWIADYALAHDWRVSGSDAQESPTTKRLQQAGAAIHIGAHPEHIPADITEAVITAAITESAPGYPELQALRQRGIPISKRSEWVGKLSKSMYTVAVAGTHGKTTTTAMIGWILEQAGLDPTVFAGTNIPAWENRTRIGKGHYLVLEADEYDRSFHRFYPKMAVILNIDLDHTDYYTGGLPEIEQSYHRFLRNLPHQQGLVVAYGRDASIRRVTKGFKYAFRWYDEENLWPGLRLPFPGEHLRLNATAAARVAHELGVDQKTILAALASFPGVGRRFERVGTWNQAEWWDDYAHHPKEIQATLGAMHEHFAGKHTAVVFQPHQKARTKSLLTEFGRSFDRNSPHTLILAPIYAVAGREQGIEVSVDDVAGAIAQHSPSGMRVQVAHDDTELETLAREASQQHDVLVSMGAGNIRQLMEQWQ